VQQHRYDNTHTTHKDMCCIQDSINIQHPPPYHTIMRPPQYSVGMVNDLDNHNPLEAVNPGLMRPCRQVLKPNPQP